VVTNNRKAIRTTQNSLHLPAFEIVPLLANAESLAGQE
jgi:hypothetical protein